jgi:FMN phosphatase YigB (HAD superfamily)
MKVFIDFDDVIFNTKEFSTDLRQFFEEYDITQDMVEKYYYNPDDIGEIKLFNPWEFFDRIENEEGIELLSARHSFADFLEDTSEYLFNDVTDFIDFIGRDNVYLVSFGIPEFQNKKISGCGLDKLVKQIIITNELKAKAIAEIILDKKMAEEDVFFIDDRVEQIENVKGNMPEIHTIYLHRKEGRYCDEKKSCCDFEVHNLIEALNVIKSNAKI